MLCLGLGSTHLKQRWCDYQRCEVKLNERIGGNCKRGEYEKRIFACKEG